MIPNGWLKRTSGDFPLAEEQTRGCRHPSSLLLECPSFLPLNPSTVFFSHVLMAVYSGAPQLGGASVVTPVCSKTQGLTGIK